jgi:hypothetical protein
VAFCAALETHLAGVTDAAGACATPRFCTHCRPEAGPEGCSRPVPVSQTAAETVEDLRAVCERVVGCVLVALTLAESTVTPANSMNST